MSGGNSCVGLSGGGQKPNCADIAFCQFRPRYIFSVSASTSTLLSFVRHIVGVRAKEQMLRPNARRVVAPMKNEHSPWNRTVVEYPRHAMGNNRIILWILRNTKQAIAEVVSCLGNPLPASISLANLNPEPVF